MQGSLMSIHDLRRVYTILGYDAFVSEVRARLGLGLSLVPSNRVVIFSRASSLCYVIECNPS